MRGSPSLSKIPGLAKLRALCQGLQKRGVSDESNLAKIVSLIKFKHFFGLFFGNKLSFSNHVEFVSFFSFFDNIVSWIVILFFQNITKLFLLIGVDFRQY